MQPTLKRAPRKHLLVVLESIVEGSLDDEPRFPPVCFGGLRDTQGSLPLLLSAGHGSFVYGPEGLPVEQITLEGTEEKVLYLHHDQQGTTRMLTNGSGLVQATFTYDPYGNLTGSTGSAVTLLGYDAQLTEAETGLIYLQAREYEPGAGEFISADPKMEMTRAPYTYADDNPLDFTDPTGQIPWAPKVREAVARCGGWKAWHSSKSPFYEKWNIYTACQNLLHLPSQVYGSEGKTSVFDHVVAAAQDFGALAFEGVKSGFIEGCALGAGSAVELGPAGMAGVCLVSGTVGAAIVGTGSGIGGAVFGGVTGKRIPVTFKPGVPGESVYP